MRLPGPGGLPRYLQRDLRRIYGKLEEANGYDLQIIVAHVRNTLAKGNSAWVEGWRWRKASQFGCDARGREILVDAANCGVTFYRKGDFLVAYSEA